MLPSPITAALAWQLLALSLRPGKGGFIWLHPFHLAAKPKKQRVVIQQRLAGAAPAFQQETLCCQQGNLFCPVVDKNDSPSVNQHCTLLRGEISLPNVWCILCDAAVVPPHPLPRVWFGVHRCQSPNSSAGSEDWRRAEPRVGSRAQQGQKACATFFFFLFLFFSPIFFSFKKKKIYFRTWGDSWFCISGSGWMKSPLGSTDVPFSGAGLLPGLCPHGVTSSPTKKRDRQ